MVTYAAVAKYAGNLAEKLGAIDPAFAPLPVGRADVGKFTFTRQESGEPYLIIVSQRADSGTQANVPYNVVITITGPRKEKAADLVSRLASDLKIEIMPAPKKLQETAAAIDKLADMLFPGAKL